jgi:hypothetical protein
MPKKRVLFVPHFESVECAQACGNLSSVFAALEYHQDKPLTASCRKIVMIFTEDPSPSPLDEVDPSIAFIRCLIDLPTVALMPPLERRFFLARCAQVQLLKLAAKWSIPEAEIKTLFVKVFDAKCSLAGTLDKTQKVDPQRMHQAEVRFQFADDENCIFFFLAVTHIQTQQCQSIPLACFPASLANLDEFKSLTWLSAQAIRISLQTHDDHWLYSIGDAAPQFSFTRAEQGDAHGQYDLGMMYLNGHIVLKDPALAKQWLQASSDQGLKRAQSALDQHVQVWR